MPRRRRSLVSGYSCAVVLLPLLLGDAWASFECNFDCIESESGAVLGRKDLRTGPLPESVKRPADDHGSERAALVGVLTARAVGPTIPLVSGNSSKGDLKFSLRSMQCSDAEAAETLDWMLLPVGRASNGDGEAYEAGVARFNGTWTEVKFTAELPTVPVVVVSPGSIDTWAVPRIENVTTTGFAAMLQGQTGKPLAGSLSWLALPEGKSTLMNLTYEARWQSDFGLEGDLGASPLFFAGLSFDRPEPAYLRMHCHEELPYFGSFRARAPACKVDPLDTIGRVAVLMLQPPEGLSTRSNQRCGPVPTMFVAASIVLALLFYGAPCVGFAMRRTKWRRQAWVLTAATMGIATLVYWLWLEPLDGFTWRARMAVNAWGFVCLLVAWGLGLIVNVPLTVFYWRRSRAERRLAKKKSMQAIPEGDPPDAEEEVPADVENNPEAEYGNTDASSPGDDTVTT